MIRRLPFIVAIALFLGSCGSIGQQAEELPDSDPAITQDLLTAEGWGPLRIGMTRDEVIATVGANANPEAVSAAEPSECEQFRPMEMPPGTLVMIERGRLSRISLGPGSELKTEEDLGVGDPAAAVKAAYGDRAITTPHKYEPAPSEYITVWTTRGVGPDARGIVYEIGQDGRVSHIHAGSGSIQYVEGCL